MSLVKTDTVFSLAKGSLSFLGGWYKLAIALAMILLAGAAMLGFLGTRLGLSIRATGDNAAMVRASSINPVSYTHLDVYKRQLLRSRSMAATGPPRCVP